ncbi:MAG: phytanoyl-CoA dioxygenase, partial [Flavobacteriales bacterium]|nr:phytanoyl-CoA dioxygenase [Flavobacteriales bacterium]
MKIRKYKLTYQIFNFFLKNQLLHNVPLFKKYGLKKKYFSPLSSEDFRGLKSELNIHDAEDSRLEMPKNKKFQYIDTRFKEPLLSWSKNGYAVLENFFSEEEIEACNQDIEKLIN